MCKVPNCQIYHMHHIWAKTFMRQSMILYHFSVIASHLLRITDYNLPHPSSATPIRGNPNQISPRSLASKKQEFLAATIVGVVCIIQCFAVFTARGYAKRGICRRRVSVCLSHSGIVSKRLYVGSHK